ncbi:hypothetical protein JCM11641_004310 [Rhodosporidiobolus odoratus]
MGNAGSTQVKTPSAAFKEVFWKLKANYPGTSEDAWDEWSEPYRTAVRHVWHLPDMEEHRKGAAQGFKQLLRNMDRSEDHHIRNVKGIDAFILEDPSAKDIRRIYYLYPETAHRLTFKVASNPSFTESTRALLWAKDTQYTFDLLFNRYSKSRGDQRPIEQEKLFNALERFDHYRRDVELGLRVRVEDLPELGDDGVLRQNPLSVHPQHSLSHRTRHRAVEPGLSQRQQSVYNNRW